jgi:hypothetical protein
MWMLLRLRKITRFDKRLQVLKGDLHFLEMMGRPGCGCLSREMDKGLEVKAWCLEGRNKDD